jgi:hypothetical protein
VGHVQQIIVAHNWSPNNAGAALYNDIAIPIILVALLVITARHVPGEATHPVLRQRPV